MVRRGDTLSGIARKFGTTLSQLLSENPGITSPANIYVSQLINIPIFAPSKIPTTYSIMAGDTLRRIANRYGLTLGQILAANQNITNPNSIYIGMRIILPGTTPTPGLTIYYVKPGDSLGAIARKFNTTQTFLLQMNLDITSPALIYVGQQLFVPISFYISPPGCVVFMSDRTGKEEVWRVDAAGKSMVQLTGISSASPEYVDSVKWSPNGRYVTYRDNGKLVIMDQCGRNPRVLAQNVSNYEWAPDESYIAFSTEHVIYTVNLRGDIKILADLNRQIQSISFFPDGRRLAGGLLTEPASGQQTSAPYTTLFTMDSSGQNIKIYDDPYIPAKQLIISPNGRYASSEWDRPNQETPEYSVMMYDFITGKLNCIAYHKLPGGFTPDSSKFLYASYGNTPSEISIVSVPEGIILRSIQSSSYIYQLQWGVSPEWILYGMTEKYYTPVETVSNTSLVIYNLVTGQKNPLVRTNFNLYPDWNVVPCSLC